MGKRINWRKRIEDAREKYIDIRDIDVDYCFLNDIGHGDFRSDKFSFDKETNSFWFNKNEGKLYRDADVYSTVQYRYYELFLNKRMPDGTDNKFVTRKVGTLGLFCDNDQDLILSCDYIGVIKKDYYNKFGSKKLAEMLNNTRNFAGSIVWPKIRIKNDKDTWNFTVNQAKGIFLKDRMDLTLLNLKDYFDSNYEISEYSCTQLRQAFDDHEKWYKHFITFEGFIDYFSLNDFVNSNYEVIKLNDDDYQEEVEKMIEKRKTRLKLHHQI